MKLTLKKAIELSIKKWEYIVKNNGDGYFLVDDLPELEDLECYCGLCEYFRVDDYCRECPLVIKKDKRKLNPDRITCMDSSHPFCKWFYDPTKKTAKKVLDLIKAIKVEE